MASAGEKTAAGQRRVLLCVCGGIAAYKACEVLRGLQKAGCEVRVAMTADAERFVGKSTFEALTRHAVADDLYAYPETFIPHVDLAEWADLALVVPATANIMAKMACGLADNCVSAALLAAACPVMVAPGMNVHMWQNAATRFNVKVLQERGVKFVLPVEGRLACGDVGAGKLADVQTIVDAALAELSNEPQVKDLLTTRILITAGPTHEAIDPVRYIANSSTGKMGYAIARAAIARGAQVVLVSGPVAIEAPQGASKIDVVSARDMYEASMAAFAGCDAAICCAAVADYTPANPADHKLKKAHEHLDTIELVETHDILRELCEQKGERVVVGFAAETNDLLANARAKLASKGADAIVANDVSRADSTFGADTSRISVVTGDGVEDHETLPLDAVANIILDKTRELLLARA